MCGLPLIWIKNLPFGDLSDVGLIQINSRLRQCGFTPARPICRRMR
jgi:hypothetical protein